MRISDWSSDVCSSDLPFLQLALPSFRRSLALGNVAKGRSTEQVGLLPDALHRGNVARFADAMAGHARSPQKAKAVWPLASVKLALSPAAYRSRPLGDHCRFPRSEERRVGEEWVCTCRYRWSPRL